MEVLLYPAMLQRITSFMNGPAAALRQYAQQRCGPYGNLSYQRILDVCVRALADGNSTMLRMLDAFCGEQLSASICSIRGGGGAL